MYSGPCGLRRASLLLCLLHKVLLLCGQTWRRRHRRLIGKGRTIPPLVARTSNTDLVILRACGLDPCNCSNELQSFCSQSISSGLRLWGPVTFPAGN